MAEPVAQWSYLYTFTYIATDWDLTDLNYYSTSRKCRPLQRANPELTALLVESLCLTFFGLLWGAIVAIARGNMGYKWAFIFGLALRILGVGLML